MLLTDCSPDDGRDIPSGTDNKGVNLSKPCCSVAPGGLERKAPRLWRGVQCHIPMCAALTQHFSRPLAPNCPCRRPWGAVCPKCPPFPDTGSSLNSGSCAPSEEPSLDQSPALKSSSGAEGPASPGFPDLSKSRELAPEFLGDPRAYVSIFEASTLGACT